jgi:hypothetical protein
VAHQAPIMNAALVQASAPAVYEAAMGISGVTLPPDPIQMEPSYDGALQQFESLPSIRVLFDNGGGNGGGQPYYPYAAFEQSWPRFPIPGTRAQSWYLSARGALGAKPPSRAGANSFRWNSHARPMNDFHGNDTGSSPGDLWTASPNYQWMPQPAGSAVSYLTAPLKSDTTVVGAGRVIVWVRSPVPYVDLQATITVVSPDGNETFVQNGWAVGGAARLNRHKSTLLEPVLGLRTSDFSPLPRRRFVEVTIPLYYEGHAYRAGSRIRVTIAAPNGDQPVWAFSETHPKKGHPTVAIAYSRRMPSSLVLPVVPGVNVSSGLPPCPGLRGEPCRAYHGFANRTAR